MTPASPEWHAEARKMAKRGKSVGQIAAALGKGKTTVRCVIDEGARQRLLLSTKVHKARVRAEIKGTRVREPSRGRDERRVIQTAYQDKEPRAPAPITLPTIKILLTQPEPEAPRLRFAPKSTIRIESPGVRRWREIHQAMMRRGLIPARPSVIEELHP